MLNFSDDAAVLKAIADDASRFGMAAFETIFEAASVPVLPNSSAWLLIRCYYAAFFAAHSLLRCIGRPYLRLDGDDVVTLTSIASAYGALGTYGISSGYHRAALDMSQRQIDFRVSGGQGASHSGFWRAFTEALTELNLSIIARSAPSSPDRVALAKLDDLKSTISINGTNGTWLIDMRNQVNYQMAHGAWFPFRGAAHDAERVRSLVERWSQDPMAISLSAAGVADVEAFVSCCVFLVALCREILLDLMVHCTRKDRSFVHYGPSAILHQAS